MVVVNGPKKQFTTAEIVAYAIVGLIVWGLLGTKLFVLVIIGVVAWKYRARIIAEYNKFAANNKGQPVKAQVVSPSPSFNVNMPKGVSMSKKKITTAVIMIIAAIGVVSSVRVINTGEVGVVTQFGQVTGRELGEGLNFVLPYGFNTVTIYDVKVQKEQVDTNAATQDLQDVTSTLVLNYRLKRDSVSHIHQNIGPTFIDKVIAPAMSEVFKGSSAQYNAGELITNRAAVKKKAYEGLKSRLAKYDIVVEDFSITNFKFSDSFANAIEEKQVAQQDAERAKFRLEAAKTDSEAQKAQAETLSDAYLRKQAIEKWDGKMPQYVGGESVFNIPLR